MKTDHRRIVRRVAGAAVLLLAVGWLAPSFFSAERYRRRLEAGLERALQRPVVFGSVSYRLLPRPGFSIENAMVREDPAFGFEPFAQIEHIDCDLRWRSLFQSRLDCARLYLLRPSFNFVKNSDGKWNVESLLRTSRVTSPTGAGSGRLGVSSTAGDLQIDADEARIDFKVGVDKKPLALTDLRARVSFDRPRGALSFRLAGVPIRTDLSSLSPGPVELEGAWVPGEGLRGPLQATLRASNALLYEWIPLVSGRNPSIYGMLEAEVGVTGSLEEPRFEGHAVVSQLHRWGELPPSDPMPGTIDLRCQFDRPRARLTIESLDASIALSRIHLTGSIDKLGSSPVLDLVGAVEHSRLEDFVTLARRLSAHGNAARTLGLSGRVDALVSIEGPWRRRQYRGYMGARDVNLTAVSESFSVSDFDARIDDGSVRLSPFRVSLAPHVQLVVEGGIERAAPEAPPKRRRSPPPAPRVEGVPRYELLMTAQGAPLHDLTGFARDIGLLAAQGVDAGGTASATFILSGTAWPATKPAINGHAELHAARLLVPGFTEPIDVPRALIQVSGDHVVVNSVVAVLGTSVFTGRLEHQGDRKQPWDFDLRSNTLSLEQGSLWFDVLGRRAPVPLLSRLPGLSSFGAVRAAGSDLFGRVSACGQFSSPTVSYRGGELKDFKSGVEVSGRVVRLEGATFRAAGGLGRGRAVVDLTNSPARVDVEAAIADSNVQALASHFPPALRKARGSLSASGHFHSRGLTHQELTDNLHGEATVQLKNVYLGDFDPLQSLAAQAGWGTLEPQRRETSVRLPPVLFRVEGRRIEFVKTPVAISGARLTLAGNYLFDGAAALDVRADLSHLNRRWLNTGSEMEPDLRLLNIRLEGSLRRLTAQPRIAAVRPALTRHNPQK